MIEIAGTVNDTVDFYATFPDTVEYKAGFPHEDSIPRLRRVAFRGTRPKSG